MLTEGFDIVVIMDDVNYKLDTKLKTTSNLFFLFFAKQTTSNLDVKQSEFLFCFGVCVRERRTW